MRQRDAANVEHGVRALRFAASSAGPRRARNWALVQAKGNGFRSDAVSIGVTAPAGRPGTSMCRSGSPRAGDTGARCRSSRDDRQATGRLAVAAAFKLHRELAPAKRGAGTEETRRSRVSWGEVLQSDDRKDRRDLSISAVLAIFMIPRRRASNWPLVQAEVGRSRERRWPSPWRRRHASRASTGGWKERCNLNWTVVQAAPRGSR